MYWWADIVFRPGKRHFMSCTSFSLFWAYYNRLRHRGPDWSGIYQHGDFFLAHQRLAIIDPASGDQPLFNEDKTIAVTVYINSPSAQDSNFSVF